MPWCISLLTLRYIYKVTNELFSSDVIKSVSYYRRIVCPFYKSCYLATMYLLLQDGVSSLQELLFSHHVFIVAECCVQFTMSMFIDHWWYLNKNGVNPINDVEWKAGTIGE